MADLYAPCVCRLTGCFDLFLPSRGVVYDEMADLYAPCVCRLTGCFDLFLPSRGVVYDEMADLYQEVQSTLSA